MTDSRISAGVAPGWPKALLALLLCLTWVLFWYRDTGTAMVTIWWRSETFAHAFLVPPISLWLIWRRRRVLASIAPQPWWPAAVLLLLAGLGWLLGEIAAVNSLAQFALVSMLVLTVPATLGLRLTWEMAFPLGFLFFSVPIGEFVIPQFMEWTADFTVMALRVTGIPVFREGNHFIIPSGSWSVVEACSGVRYLIASIVVGTLYAYLSYRSLTKRLIFIFVAIVVPIVANWLRAYIIVMLGHLSGNRLAVGVDHLIYGWVFFGVVMILMYLIGARWADNPDPNEPGTVMPPKAGAGRLMGEYQVALAVVVAVVMPLAWLNVIESAESTRVAPAPDLALPAFSGWQVADRREVDWTPAYDGMRATLREEFVKDGRRVGLFVGFYRQQDYERKLISSENVMVASNDRAWALVDTGEHETSVGAHSLSVDTAGLKAGGGNRLIAWRWYWVDGRWTANSYLVKLYQAMGRLAGRGDDSAVVIVYAWDDIKGAAAADLAAFARDAGDPVNRLLRFGQ